MLHRKFCTVAISFLMISLLLACAGGDSSEVKPEPVLVTDCAGVNCGAVDSTHYSGSGIGLWTYKNTTSAAITLPVSITGVAGKEATIVYTNQSDAAVSMPGISLAPAFRRAGDALRASGKPQRSGDPAPLEIQLQREQFARAFQHARAQSLPARKLAYAPVRFWVVGDTRTINTFDDTVITITLKKTLSTQDGTAVNIWVDENEFGSSKVTMNTLDTFASRYATGSNSIYSQVTHLIGKPWGAHAYQELIPPGQSINIVFYNAGNEGWGGYFYSGDAAIPDYWPQSNAWLAFYVNSAQLYNGAEYFDLIQNYYTSVLTHEFTHMIHFYQRAVLLDKSFDTWLNEFAALGMEDIVSRNVFRSVDSCALYSCYDIPDYFYAAWLAQGDFNLQPENWGGVSSSSYDINASWSAFLNRQYGLAYYQALFASSETDSNAILDNAIKSVGGPGYLDAMRRWGASIAMLPAASTPAGYGYPARSDTVGGITYPLAEINGPDFAKLRRLPDSVPASLVPHGHFPLVRRNLGDTIIEDLTVPPGTSVTIVIQ